MLLELLENRVDCGVLGTCFSRDLLDGLHVHQDVEQKVNALLVAVPHFLSLAAPPNQGVLAFVGDRFLRHSSLVLCKGATWLILVTKITVSVRNPIRLLEGVEHA